MNKSLNLHKKTTNSRILVVVVNWRHRAYVLFAVTATMASKSKPSEPDPGWQSWKVPVKFDVGALVSPTGIEDTAEHAGICSICWTNVKSVFVLTHMHGCTESEQNCTAHPNWLLLQHQRPATKQTSQKTPSPREMSTFISIKSSGHWDISK